MTLLFDVRPTDAATLLGAAALMSVVGVLGACLPARLVSGSIRRSRCARSDVGARPAARPPPALARLAGKAV